MTDWASLEHDGATVRNSAESHALDEKTTKRQSFYSFGVVLTDRRLQGGCWSVGSRICIDFRPKLLGHPFVCFYMLLA